MKRLKEKWKKDKMSHMHPEAIAHLPLSMQVIIKRIAQRVEGNKNCLVIVVGATGSGKSYATLHLMMGVYLYQHGRLPTPEYLASHVVFKAKDFMTAMNNPDLKKKEIWNWDEAGIDMGHKEQMSIRNKVIGWLAQTFRNLGQIVFLTVPSANFIDASVRRLLHYYFETIALDRRTKTCYLKPLIIQYNTKINKIYFHRFEFVNHQTKTIEKLQMMSVPLAPPQVLDLYEKKKTAFTKELNLKIQMMLEKAEQKENPVNQLTARQKQIWDLLCEGVVRTGEIAKRLGIPDGTVSDQYRWMRKKGVDVDGKRAEFRFQEQISEQMSQRQAEKKAKNSIMSGLGVPQIRK